MGLVHSFVAEVLAHLIDTLKATDDEALQVELSSNTHVHVLVERIEVGDERTGTGTACNVLQDWGVNFRVAGIVQNATQGTNNGCTLQEGVLHTIIDHQIDITLTVTQLRIVKLVVGHTVLVLHDGQRLQRLRQQRQLLGMYGYLARLCAEYETLDAYEVANVKQTLEDCIVKLFILVRAKVVAGNVHLDTAFGIL